MSLRHISGIRFTHPSRIERRPARATHCEHLLRNDIVRGAADGGLGVGVEVGEGGVFFFAALLVRERVAEDGVFGQLGEAEVVGHVVEVGAVVLTHEEKLARVAEDGAADSAFFEPPVLLDDGDIPTVELPHLRVAFLHDLLAAGDVEQARDFLIDVPFSQTARESDDVLARVVRDEKSRHGAEQLCGLRDVSEFKVCDLSGE